MNNFVYICMGRGSNQKENIERKMLYKQYIIEEGYYPVSPSIDFSRDDEEYDSEYQNQIEMSALEQCGQMWVFGDIIDEQMQGKIERAEDIDINIEYISDWECLI